MDINSQLIELYEPKWLNLLQNGRKITDPLPADPLLLCFDSAKFSAAHKRILICGQETWGWGDFGSTVEDCMEEYRRFFINAEFYDGYGGSAFWKAFRFFEAQLESIFEGQRLQFIWQNISKIGRNDDTGVTDEIRKLERGHFPVFKEEMKILKPNIVLFLTGPDRDHDIQFHFPDVQFSQAGDEPNLRRRAWVSSAELPFLSLRLYHPNYYAAWTHQYKNEAVSLLKNRA
ncbi:hypothetical protein WG68_08670 [Arsukibacterium ikkense]|uniref:Uracil-DNA glycosylase-like domain-containing protein n=1 Tax=Arsukibacterium ikkense TaxID=336831 RepID=A0A0M2V5V9_9GAMM|nr:hypothetical protein [Arsukibacterium ikkense]KKO45779.1 hypothetical protein WG68_08670 [Arsukibacterium ikkense]